MSELLKICIDRVLPRALREEASLRAIEENPANLAKPQSPDAAPADLELALDARKLWKPGRVLHVRFLDGIKAVQDKVAEVAQLWCQSANIKLLFDNDPKAEIRITFRQTGSWSYIGTDALLIKQGEPTMNFGWLAPNTDDDEYSRVVLHEFGHALGCIHEHQNPGGHIPWNEGAVLAFYMGPPNYWLADEVQSNILAKYDCAYTKYTDFDPHSIMLYPIPKAHTLGGFEVPWENCRLSESDKQFIAEMYPF